VGDYTVGIAEVADDFREDMQSSGVLREQTNGTSGNDTFISTAGFDAFFGSGGDDGFVAGDGYDLYSGGSGIDTVSFSQFVSGINVDLRLGGLLENELPRIQISGVENVEGSNFADLIVGNSSANLLSGGSGDDVLGGWAGIDTLTGGAGLDTFKDVAAGLNGDTITDFSRGDVILITDATLAGFSFLLSGDLLTYTGGSLTLSNLHNAAIVASAAPGHGVQMRFASPPIVISSGASVAIATQAGLAAETKTGLSRYGAIESNSSNLFEQDRGLPDAHLSWRDSLPMHAHWDGQGVALLHLPPNWPAADLFQ
jgi:Ca2+-binding RTX toxin-like protein